MSAAEAAPRPRADDPSRPVSVRVLTVFERLRRRIGAQAALAEAVDALGLARLPGEAEGPGRDGLAAISEDGALSLLALWEPRTGRSSLRVDTGAPLDPEEIRAMVAGVYGLGEAEAVAAEGAVLGGWAWEAELAGRAHRIAVLRLAGDRTRLVALTDPALAAGRRGPD